MSEIVEIKIETRGRPKLAEKKKRVYNRPEGYFRDYYAKNKVVMRASKQKWLDKNKDYHKLYFKKSKMDKATQTMTS